MKTRTWFAVVALGLAVGCSDGPKGESKKATSAAGKKSLKSSARSWSGITHKTLDPKTAKQLGLTTASGSLVTDLADDGPAERGGIEEGDVILAVNGKRVSDARSTARRLAASPAGHKVSIKVWRDGQAKTVSFVTGTKPR